MPRIRPEQPANRPLPVLWAVLCAAALALSACGTGTLGPVGAQPEQSQREQQPQPPLHVPAPGRSELGWQPRGWARSLSLSLSSPNLQALLLTT